MPPSTRFARLRPDGSIQTVAGTGVAGFAGDGGPANAALLNQPYGLALDTAGNLYIADLGNARVRKVGDGWHHPDRGRRRRITRHQHRPRRSSH